MPLLGTLTPTAPTATTPTLTSPTLTSPALTTPTPAAPRSAAIHATAAALLGRTGAPTPVPPRLLAVVVDRERALDVLDTAYSAARAGGREVHTALLLPHAPLALGSRVRAERNDEADREARELVTLAAQRAAAAGVQARIGLHRVGGRNDRDRRRSIDRTVTRLARRLDAVPVGWPAP